MPGFYERLRDTTAAPLIARFGYDITVKRVVESYDVNTGANNRTITSQVVKAVVFNYDTMGEGGDQARGGIQHGDRQVIVAAKGVTFVPETGDIVVLEGLDWQVVRAIVLAPGGIPVTYELQARR